jgi:hypothetical protein
MRFRIGAGVGLGKRTREQRTFEKRTREQSPFEGTGEIRSQSVERGWEE